MEWPCGWAILYLLIYVSNVSCQNNPLERMLPEVSAQPQTANLKREVIQTQSPSKAQLINALFSYATAKGLLPKTTQIIQSTLPQEKPQIATSQNAPKLFNIVPLQPQMVSNCDKQPIISSIPAVSVNSIQNQVSPPATSCSQGLMLQPRLQTESVSWTLSPQTCQGVRLENCACTQPPQTVWQIPQPPQPVTTMDSCPSNQPFVFNEAILPFANLQISPPSCIFTPTNTECSTVENVYETNCGTLTEEPLLATCDSKPGIPINLQINIPSPNDQCPTIKIVTSAPTNPEPVAAFSPYAFPPPPIMMTKSRSCLRKLLPILLLALIDDCGSCGGYNCPYNNCDSDDIIPIPYPIPIPVNNPIINVCNSPCSSRNRESRDYGNVAYN